MFRPTHCFYLLVLRKGKKKKKTSFPLFLVTAQHYDSGTLGLETFINMTGKKVIFLRVIF